MPLLHLQSSTSIQGISSSHPNQNWLEQAVSLHSVVSQWDWAYQGHIKTHNGCACWSNGVMVLTQMMCLEDLVSTAVPWCHPTAVLWAWEHEWGVLLLFPFVQCICWIYSILLCHLPRRKTCHVETISVLQSIRLLWEADLLQHRW